MPTVGDSAWWRDLGSNQGPPAYEAGELPLLYPALIGSRARPCWTLPGVGLHAGGGLFAWRPCAGGLVNRIASKGRQVFLEPFYLADPWIVDFPLGEFGQP